MIRNYLLSLLWIMSVSSYSQKIAVFTVELSKSADQLDVPVSVDLDAVTFLPDSSLTLVEVMGTMRTPVPCQIEQGDNRTLHWIVKPKSKETTKQVYELVQSARGVFDAIVASKDGQSLTIHTGDQNLLRYRYSTMYPPAGIDTAYKRSGYIHPLWSPRGQELTRIQPPDHFHHYGIWNPWTHVLYKGDTIDFWNIAGRKGTVRFSKFISTTQGPVFSEFQVLHEHVVMKVKQKVVDEVALNELQTIRVYRPERNQAYYVADLTFHMNCATAESFNILAYRYAGLGWRATQQWDKNNSEFLSSEGKTRKDADGTKARWFIMQGSVGNDYAGVVMMSYPSNYNHPEPMRIWPENQYDRGDVFVSFAPTKDKDWLLKPGQKYVLKYRFVVFNGHFTKEKAESAWQNFAAPPRITIKKNS